jgi:hypothetical protein
MLTKPRNVLEKEQNPLNTAIPRMDLISIPEMDVASLLIMIIIIFRDDIFNPYK